MEPIWRCPGEGAKGTGLSFRVYQCKKLFSLWLLGYFSEASATFQRDHIMLIHVACVQGQDPCGTWLGGDELGTCEDSRRVLGPLAMPRRH